MAWGVESADAGMAQHLQSSGPVSGHVRVGETQQHANAGTSRGFGACVSRTSSTVSGGLQLTVATIFGWASGLWNPFASPHAGDGHSGHDESD